MFLTVPEVLESSSRVYNVTSFGAGLPEEWPSSGRVGEVIATFEHSCYVVGPTGRLVCIAGDHVDDGPAMLKVAFGRAFDMEALGVRLGMPVYLQGGDLLLGGHIRLRMEGAVPWTPPPIGRTAPRGAIVRCLQALVQELIPFVPDAGLAPLVPHSECLARGRHLPVGMQSEIFRLALPGVTAIVNGLSHRNERGVERGVQSLVGLGPGLTPSGDDFLGGMMVALTSVRTDACDTTSEAGSDMDAMRSALANSVRGSVAAGTTRISASLLSYAAEGVASAAVHRLVRGVLKADTRTRCSHVALQLAGVGHTSGWDCLAGLFVGMHVALASRRPGVSDVPRQTLASARAEA